MTREEALIKVKGYLTDLLPIEDCDEIEEIMSALEQQPCGDCISRQAMLEVQTKYAEHMGATKYWQMRDDIRTLSPVIPQPKIGRWMECGGDEPWLKGYCCSLCNFTTAQKYDYCTCGAKMVEPQKSEGI